MYPQPRSLVNSPLLFRNQYVFFCIFLVMSIPLFNPWEQGVIDAKGITSQLVG